MPLNRSTMNIIGIASPLETETTEYRPPLKNPAATMAAATIKIAILFIAAPSITERYGPPLKLIDQDR